MFFEEGYISIPECYRTYREIARRHHPIWPESDGPVAGSGMSGVSRSPENQALLDTYRMAERLRLNTARRACLNKLSVLIEHVRIVRPFGNPLAVAPWVLQVHTRYPASPAFFDLETGLVGYWRREPCPLEDLEIYDAETPAAERMLMAAPTILFCSGLEPVEGLDAWRGCFLAMKRRPWVCAGDRDDEESRAARDREHEVNFMGFIHDWRTAEPEQTARHMVELFGRDELAGLTRKTLDRFVGVNLRNHGRTGRTKYARAVRDELANLVPEITKSGPKV